MYNNFIYNINRYTGMYDVNMLVRDCAHLPANAKLINIAQPHVRFDFLVLDATHDQVRVFRRQENLRNLKT